MPPAPAAAPAPPAWGGSPGYQRPPKNERSTTGLRVASALLLFVAAAFTLVGIVPEYYDIGFSLGEDRQALVMSLGYGAALFLTGVFLLVARSPRWAAAAGATALIVSTTAAAIRLGEFGNLSSLDLSAGVGFWLQTAGDLFAASVWILAIVILVNARSRIGADVRSLGPAAAGFLGLVTLIVGQASSRFSYDYTAMGGSGDGIAVPGMFDDFGWRNTTQVLIWFMVVLAIALGTFLFPRLAGGWGLLTGAVMILILEVLPPLAATGQAQGMGSFGDDMLEVNLRLPFAWTIASFVLLAVGAVLALIAPERDKPGAAPTT